MNQKELTKTFMMLSNRKNHFEFQGFNKKNSALQGLSKGLDEIAYLLLSLRRLSSRMRSRNVTMSSYPGKNTKIAPKHKKHLIRIETPRVQVQCYQ